MPGKVSFRTSDTCIDINCSFTIPRNIVQFSRFSIRRKFMLGLILGLIGALTSDGIIFIINGAIAADKPNEPEEEYFENYDSPGFHDYIPSDLPLSVYKDPVVKLAFNDTSLDERTVLQLEHTIADVLSKKVRILCWVLTSPRTHHTRAIHVKKTWGKRCNILLFMSTKNDSVLGTVALNITEGRRSLSRKTREAFRYIYHHYRDQADWFLKADDDTYVVVENLRQFLSTQLSDEPVYFGCRFKMYVRQGYMSGGSGYVLSKTALEYLVEYGIEGDIWQCTHTSRGGVEDVEMGRCLESVGVIAGDSRDEKGSYRFFPLTVERHVNPYAIPRRSWYFKYIFYPQPTGLSCCSDSAISFHYAKPDNMYSMNYLLYRHRVIFDS